MVDLVACCNIIIFLLIETLYVIHMYRAVKLEFEINRDLLADAKLAEEALWLGDASSLVAELHLLVQL